MPDLIWITDDQASGGNGCGATQNAWSTRWLNTVMVNEIAGASLASDRVTLPAGTYDVAAVYAFSYASSNKHRLYDVTNGAELCRAANVNTSTGAAAMLGRFTLAGTAEIELQMFSTAGTSSGARGGAAISAEGGTERYVSLMIEKVS